MKKFVMFKVGDFVGRGTLEAPSIMVRNWYLNNSNYSIKFILTTNTPATSLSGFNELDAFSNNPTITITAGQEVKKLRVLNTNTAGVNRLIMEVGL